MLETHTQTHREAPTTPTKNTYGFYCKWSIKARRQAENPCYVEIEGLEWGTHDRYQKEIKEKCYDTWLQELKKPEEWKRRVKILEDSIGTISKYIIS